ncbi:MAG: hydroxymethylglutaryl-CoA lyase [Nitrospira sp.]|nr:hydroxymethylglutaryl-CoA lyase [Nitrospira sp.]MCP9461319.1 hydroxymethylglutaryl-CoA lyase [Nitrospira sp.]MCP9474158.1 hydroxymethylglutaryl-CoA lyase [Nitrospira sp.]
MAERAMTESKGNRSPLTDIRIVEVGPRDGLQHEPAVLSIEDKVSFVNDLSRSGVAEIEVGSFVSPRAVPQMADTDQVFARIDRRLGVLYSALVPNERGWERAEASQVDKIALFTAASDTFTQRNINCTIGESVQRFRPIVSAAKRGDVMVRGYISTVTHCPFEGPVPPSKVLDVAKRLLDLGIDELSLGETMGMAAPNHIKRLLDELLRHIPAAMLSLHVHDTYGLGIANVLTAWAEYGLRTFDTSAGGLGGCPFAPGATGNVATEDVAHALRTSGAAVKVDERAVVAAALKLEPVIGHPLVSRVSRVLREGLPSDVRCEVVP